MAIGDIHGRADLLNKLLKKLERRLRGRPHQTIFLGDYVDRGRHSRDVLNLLLAYQDCYPETVFLKGNHEQAMLDFLANPEDCVEWLDWGGEETLLSYGVEVERPLDLGALQKRMADTLPESQFQFLMNLKLTYETGLYFFVHAGVDPDQPIWEQSEREYLWIREPFLEREGDVFGGRIIVHGHTPVKKPDNRPWRINVDTGAFWTNRLTAVLLDGDQRQFIST